MLSDFSAKLSPLSLSSNWQHSSGDFSIVTDECVVWACSALPLVDLNEFYIYLNGEEQQQAESFRHVGAKQRFVIGRSFLRLLLCGCLNVEGVQIDLVFGEHGKPDLADGIRLNCGELGKRLQFNVSHSGEVVLIVFCLDHLIGVDVETIDPNLEYDKIALRYFSNLEAGVVLSGSTEGQLEKFYRCWTAKEAFIKAVGAGIAYPLKKFSVDVENNEVCLIEHPDGIDTAKEWMIRRIEVCEGYEGALAVNGEMERVRFYFI